MSMFDEDDVTHLSQLASEPLNPAAPREPTNFQGAFAPAGAQPNGTGSDAAAAGAPAAAAAQPAAAAAPRQSTLGSSKVNSHVTHRRRRGCPRNTSPKALLPQCTPTCDTPSALAAAANWS